MSALKEEWASLMKLRESGVIDTSKKQEIKSRVFNNFYSNHKETPKNGPDMSQINIKSDYQTMREQFLSTISTTGRSKTPEIPKKFTFGLPKIIPSPAIQKKNNNPAAKITEIWDINDTPYKSFNKEAISDRYEYNSIADVQLYTEKQVFQQKKINIFTDLSPVTRYLSNITQEDEEQYLKETKNHENHMCSYFQLIHCDIREVNLEKIDWNSARKFSIGLIFKSEIKSNQHPALITSKNVPNFIENTKTSVSQCLTEPPMLLDYSLLKTSNLKNSSSASPLLQPKNDNSLLEGDLLDMMDIIKNKDESTNINEKLKTLLNYTNDKLKNNREIASNMHVQVLYQFLLEYFKKNEPIIKPPAMKKFLHSKTTQKKAVTPIKERPLKSTESATSINSAKSSKWIGGNKYKDEFENDDWINIKQEKIKKETRNEHLYKLSHKERKK